MYTFLEEILSKEIFKINAGCSSQRPLIFNITNEEEFLKMVNSVFSGTEEELSIFSDFFTLRKSEAINEDEEECEEEFPVAEFYDLYSFDEEAMGIEDSYYTAPILLRNSVVFHHKFNTPIVCVIYIIRDFDSFTEKSVKLFFHFKYSDLLKNGILIVWKKESEDQNLS